MKAPPFRSSSERVNHSCSGGSVDHMYAPDVGFNSRPSYMYYYICSKSHEPGTLCIQPWTLLQNYDTLFQKEKMFNKIRYSAHIMYVYQLSLSEISIIKMS